MGQNGRPYGLKRVGDGRAVPRSMLSSPDVRRAWLMCRLNLCKAHYSGLQNHLQKCIDCPWFLKVVPR